MKFNEGDTVSRKAGGPLMTVEENRNDGFVSVAWFDLDGTLHRDSFHPTILQKWVLSE